MDLLRRLYTHMHKYTQKNRESERQRGRSIHTVDSATWSKATGREGETRALKMVLQLILWVLAVTLSKYTAAHTQARCSALSYLTKGRARRVSHSNRGTRLSLVWGAEALFPPGGVHEYLRGGERLFLFSLNRKQHQEWRESETTRAGEPDCHPVSPRLRSRIWCYNFPT